MSRLALGTEVPEFSAVAASGSQITSQGLRGAPALLQFHRFSTCPACFSSVGRFTTRGGELRDEGLEIVAFFYSSPTELAESLKDLAPDCERVGDPEQAIFERSHLKFVDPRSIATGVSGWFKGAKFQPLAKLTQEDTAVVPDDSYSTPMASSGMPTTADTRPTHWESTMSWRPIEPSPDRQQTVVRS